MGREFQFVSLRPFAPNVNPENFRPEEWATYIKSPAAYRLRFSGVAGNRSLETVPLFEQTPSEVVLENQRNAWIVLGVDRNRGITSGKGGKGQTQCGAIDLVAGRMGSYARGYDDKGNPIKANPDFTIDSARVYISQKSDIDRYFHLVDGRVGNPSSVSAVGIKADEVRLISRGGIKLVTGTDMRDSQGDRVFQSRGIDLIAGNDDSDMQPLVKGDNLVFAFMDLATEIEQLREIMTKFLDTQNKFNSEILTHTHKSPFYGLESLFETKAMFSQGIQTLVDTVSKVWIQGIVGHQATFSTWQNDYLSPFGHSFICSKRNHTN
jgi:hypothetical protein